MIIQPNIFTPDRPVVQYKEPSTAVDLDVELPRILSNQGWTAGTFFHVQFFNHEMTKLISYGLYMVVESKPYLQTSEANPYQPMTRTGFLHKAEQVGDWWYAAEASEIDKEPRPQPRKQPAPTKRKTA